MSESVLTALIAALIPSALSLIGVVIVNRRSAAEMYAKLERQSEIEDIKLNAALENYKSLTDAKIDELTREVRTHNQFAARMPRLEEKIEQLERRLGA